MRSENNKISKIVAEITLYLLNRKIEMFHIHVKMTETLETLEITTETMADDVLDYFKKKMEREREEEIETYGWSLMGESDLEITGLLVDSVDVETKDGHTIITLKRKRT